MSKIQPIFWSKLQAVVRRKSIIFVENVARKAKIAEKWAGF